ncbi:MAG: DUF4907 domain-containing protein [Bacteroidales bacterium]
MIKRKRIFTGFAFFLALTIMVIIYAERGHSRFYRVDVYRVDKGWGYDIILKNKVYIHQPFIPAIEGEMPFPDKRSARRTGDLVITKLKNHKPPAVSREELKSILPAAP